MLTQDTIQDKKIREFFLKNKKDFDIQDDRTDFSLPFIRECKEQCKDKIAKLQSKQESRTFGNSVSKRFKSLGDASKSWFKGGQWVNKHTIGKTAGATLCVPGAVIGLVGGTAVGLVAPQTATILDIDGGNKLTYAEGLTGCVVGGTVAGAASGFAVGYYTTSYAIGGVAATVCAVGGAIPTTIRVGSDFVKGFSNKITIKNLEHKVEKLENFISWKEEQHILMLQTE